MQIKFRTKKLEKICSEYAYSVKTYGPEMAVKINMRLDQISAADSVEMLIAGRIGRCHPLTGNLQKYMRWILFIHTGLNLKRLRIQFALLELSL